MGRWRRLTGGGAPTLVACSGGADSSALALALGAFGEGVAVGHIRHDLRPEAESGADRDRASGLAREIGVPFFEGECAVREMAGNAEANARRCRYRAMAGLAQRAGTPFVATAHHADDQFESVLMALMRGAGPDGLRGIALRRGLSAGVTLIRPMLHVRRVDAEEVCRVAGVEWAVDRTNLEPGRLRAALRLGPLAELTRLRPGAAVAAARSADLQRQAARLVRGASEALFGEGDEWTRSALRGQPAIVLGAGLRRAAVRLGGGSGADRLSSRVVGPVVRAIRDGSTEPRRFDWPGGLVVEVTASVVRVRRVG